METSKKIKPCPVCGDRHLIKCKSLTRRWKRYWIKCKYCCYCGENAHTPRGAIRKWNRATNGALIIGREGDGGRAEI